MSQRILVIGDISTDQVLYSALQSGFAVSVVIIGETGGPKPADHSFDLLILDLADARRAIEVLKETRAGAKSRAFASLVIAEWGTGQATLALAAGADAFEAKPINSARLVSAVERLLRPAMVKSANASTSDSDDD